MVYQGGYTRVGITGGYTRVGIQGSTQPARAPREEVPIPSGAGPGTPAGGGVGGVWGWARDPGDGGRGGYIPTLRARSVPAGPPWDIPLELPTYGQKGEI